MLIYIVCRIHILPQIFTNPFIRNGDLNAFLSYGSANSRGTAIFISNSTDYKIHNSVADSNGNFCAVDISVSEYRFTLLSLYGPNIDSPSFLLISLKPLKDLKMILLLYVATLTLLLIL